MRKRTYKALKIVSYPKRKVASYFEGGFFNWPFGPVHTGYFLIHNFFFPDLKTSTSTRIRIQIEFALPHVSDTYREPSSIQDSSGNIGNRACVEVSILNTVFTGKELGSLLLRHRIKNYPDLASKRFRIYSGFKNLCIRMPNSPNRCGLMPYPERKSCGFKNNHN